AMTCCWACSSWLVTGCRFEFEDVSSVGSVAAAVAVGATSSALRAPASATVVPAAALPTARLAFVVFVVFRGWARPLLAMVVHSSWSWSCHQDAVMQATQSTCLKSILINSAGPHSIKLGNLLGRPGQPYHSTKMAIDVLISARSSFARRRRSSYASHINKSPV